jgi:signal transduction histidine kinase
MRPLYRLHTRLSLAALLLVVGLGGVLLYTTGTTSERYALEVTQRLNRDIAIHAAEDMPLFENGAVNKVALKELAHHVMFINPIVEVYLLDLQGRILAHALPYDTVLVDRVDMAPLQDFMNETRTLPIFGDDPRNPGQRQVFSISPVMADGEAAGYLYTVLGGRQYAGLRESLRENYNLRAGAMTMLGSLLVAIAIGVLLFAWLTRPLQSVLGQVRSYRESTTEEPDAPHRALPRNEIEELQLAIERMNARIDRQIQALQDSDRTRRELIANVSHDLRTPLASMQGYLETLLLKGDTLTAQQRDSYLQVAHKHSQRLNTLVKELFELSRLEAHTTEPKLETFSLMELVQDTLQDFELKAAQRDITLNAQSRDNAISVVADIAMIHRVLDNLLENAIRHTPRGGEVTLTISSDADRARIEVKDTGHGISAHDIPHIFDRFYRPAESTAFETQRTGLGLAIVKRIIELHRSRVDVVSEPDKGTAFVFWLPQAAHA